MLFVVIYILNLIWFVGIIKHLERNIGASKETRDNREDKQKYNTFELEHN